MAMELDVTKEIVLEGERSRLEPLTLDHIVDFLPISRSYPDLLKYSPRQFGSDEAVQMYVEDALAGRASGIRYPFAIYDKQAGKYVGSTSFGAISNDNQRVEIGWTWISKEFQRTGLNRHNKYLMLRYAFETLGFIRVELKTDGRNQQSRTAMEKIGATYEGTLRSHTVMPDGFRRDTAYYSILVDEWPEIRQRVFGAILS